MKQQSILAGVVLAACLGAMTLVAEIVLRGAFGARMVIAALLIGGITGCLLQAKRATGRITLALIAAIIAAWAIVSFSLHLFLIVSVGLLWGVRSLTRYSSAVVALIDLGATILSFFFAVWVIGHSGSMAVAVWSFFLLQAPLVLLPQAISKGTPRESERLSRFESALATAEASLRQIVAQSASPGAR